MTAHPAEPLSREDAALATWEEDMAVIAENLRRDLELAGAAGHLTPAERARITEDHVYAAWRCCSLLMEAMCRGPYPPGRAQRGGGAA